jgi:hypothetical protein
MAHQLTGLDFDPSNAFRGLLRSDPMSIVITLCVTDGLLLSRLDGSGPRRQVVLDPHATPYLGAPS